MWQHYTNAILGLVLVGISLLANTTMTVTLAWTVGIIGLAVLILGLWGAGALTSFKSEMKARHA